MAFSASQTTGVGKSLDVEKGVITWTSTTATGELSTSLSEIYNATFTRIGTDDVDDQGVLTIDETVTSGVLTVSGGAITIDRSPSTGTGTLTGESFFYVLEGKS